MMKEPPTLIRMKVQVIKSDLQHVKKLAEWPKPPLPYFTYVYLYT